MMGTSTARFIPPVQSIYICSTYSIYIYSIYIYIGSKQNLFYHKCVQDINMFWLIGCPFVLLLFFSYDELLSFPAQTTNPCPPVYKIEEKLALLWCHFYLSFNCDVLIFSFWMLNDYSFSPTRLEEQTGFMSLKDHMGHAII